MHYKVIHKRKGGENIEREKIIEGIINKFEYTELIRDIEREFLENMSVDAIKYYIKGWTFPSWLEEDYNNSAAKIAEKIKELHTIGRLHPVDAIKLLYKFEPFTKKTKNFPEHYIKAREAWNQAFNFILSKMDWETVQLLSSDLQRAWKRAKAYGQVHVAYIYNEWTIRFEREQKKDCWQLFIWNRDTNVKFISPQVSIGHLSAKKLELKANICNCNNTVTIDVTVDHPEKYPRWICENYCKLPVKILVKISQDKAEFGDWQRCVQS